MGLTEIIYKEESYLINGICMEIHRNLGSGFLEVVYKDALEYEFIAANIFYEREKEYQVRYKDIILPHLFKADFVVFGKIILEVKSTSMMNPLFTAQTINYLKISGNKLGILANFGENSLVTKRIVL